MVNLDQIRAKALAKGMLIDREAVATRVLKGDVYLAQLVVLVALVKSDHSAQRRILDILSREDFRGLERRIFDWWVAAAREDRVTPDLLYARMEVYVRQEVAQTYQEELTQILANARTNSDDVDRTIAWLRRKGEQEQNNVDAEDDLHEDAILAILASPDDVSRARLMEVLDRTWEAGIEPVERINRAWILRCLVASVRAKGRVDEAYVRGRLEEFVAGPLLDNISQVLDRIFAMDEPDDTVLNAAIARLQQHAKNRL